MPGGETGSPRGITLLACAVLFACGGLMANLVPEPGYEAAHANRSFLSSQFPTTGWAERTMDYGSNSGVYAGHLRLPTGGFSQEITYLTVPTIDLGTYKFSVWLKRRLTPTPNLLISLQLPNVGGSPFYVDVSDTQALYYTVADPFSAPVLISTQPISDPGNWFQLSVAFDMPAGWGDYGNPNFDSVVSNGGAGWLGAWLLDDWILEEATMAVRLAERSIDAITTRLQGQLATELAAIEADRGDGIVLDVPAAGDYFRRDKVENAGSAVQIEVFERLLEFGQPYTDADAQVATYDLPVVVRVTVFNKRVESADVMVRRIRRYGCGIYNVLHKSATLAGLDPAVRLVVSNRVVPYDVIDRDANPAIKLATEIHMISSCEEIQS